MLYQIKKICDYCGKRTFDWKLVNGIIRCWSCDKEKISRIKE